MLGCASAILSFFQHAGCSGSDFVTNSYGESWDSFCEQIMCPTPEPLSPSSKNSTGNSPWANTPKIGFFCTMSRDQCYHIFLKSAITEVYFIV